jgi:hypothetical protein
MQVDERQEENYDPKWPVSRAECTGEKININKHYVDH